MLVSHSWCEEVAKEILWEFEQLLCDNDIKINNRDSEENEFESEDSYINIVEKKEKIEELYFNEKMSLTEIASQLGVSVSYVSKILRKNSNYNIEQERRKKENKIFRREKQKELIYKLRKNKAKENIIENYALKRKHEQDVRELSKRRTLGNDALRKWCSLYKYDKEKQKYKFDDSKILKPNDFPLYIKG